MARWAMQLDGCRPGPEVSRPTPMVVRRSWGNWRDGSRVVPYTVLGGGHSWPGAPITLPVGAFGPTTRQIDATALMLGFFARTGLPR